MVAIENPQNYQCALFKSSRKHYEHALEMHVAGKDIHGQLTAAVETAEAAGDDELHTWLGNLLAQYGSSGMERETATNIVTRYNEYNLICGWELADFDPNDPFKLPGGGGVDF